MISGKIFLIVVLVLVSAIGLGILQDTGSKETQKVSSEFSSEGKTIGVEISDGVGSKDIG